MRNMKLSLYQKENFLIRSWSSLKVRYMNIMAVADQLEVAMQQAVALKVVVQQVVVLLVLVQARQAAMAERVIIL